MQFESKFYIGEQVRDVITGYTGTITSVTFEPGNENLYAVDSLDAANCLCSIALGESRLVSCKSNNTTPEDNKHKNNNKPEKSFGNLFGIEDFIEMMIRKERNGESVPSPELMASAIAKTNANEELNYEEEKALKLMDDFFGFKC